MCHTQLFCFFIDPQKKNVNNNTLHMRLVVTKVEFQFLFVIFFFAIPRSNTPSSLELLNVAPF